MTTKLCRWGILGTANIARKNWQAIRDAGNATLRAVASRDATRSARFITECQQDIPFDETPDALASYEDLIAHPAVDALYLPLPTGIRKEWVLRAAAAGKHVLVEKPVGCSAADVAEMIDACARHGVQFMDGVMFMHSRRLNRLREVLDDGLSVGDIRHISAQFSFPGDESFLKRDIRTDSHLEPFGCLGDLGWYCIRMALWVMRYEMPASVTGRMHSSCDRTSPPVPTEFSGELVFARGVSASFHCSFVAGNAEWVSIGGTRGFVHVPDFVLPFSGTKTRFGITRSEFVLNNCRFDMHERRSEATVDEPSSNAPGSQESNLFRAFSALVLGGKPDPHWPDIALKTQQVMDACQKSAQQDSRTVTPGLAR